MITDSDGFFKMKSPFNKGTNWIIIYKFKGTSDYERFSTLGFLNMSFGYNLEYLFSIPIAYNITVNGNSISVPYGREIGIYKNNKIYRLTYGYSESNCTQIKDNISYFISFVDSNGIHRLNSTVYNENCPGLWIKSNGVCINIAYLGYFTEDINQFSVVFDGKKINNKYSSYMSFIYNNVDVASLYFSSKIYTTNTKESIYNKTHISYSNYTIYIIYLFSIYNYSY